MNKRMVEAVGLLVISVLTLAAAYIHFFVGGILLWLNAAGAVAILGAVMGTHLVFRGARPLALMALAVYSAGSIMGWAIMGPYFDLANVAKAIELGLITAIGAELWRTRSDIAPALRWFLSVAAALPIVGQAFASRGRVMRPASGEE